MLLVTADTHAQMIIKALATTLLLLTLTQHTQAQTGVAVPELAELDQIMSSLLTKYNIPGGALAYTYRGRLVYARGFGLADRNSTEAVTPDSIFRVASLSKPLTALGLLKLLDSGKIRLDDLAFSTILSNYSVPPNRTLAPGVNSITVRQLLQHTAGLSPNKTNDPMFNPVLSEISRAFQITAPPSTEQVVRYAMSLPLANAPGAVYDYSNVGLAAVGRVIEKVSGKSYEQYLREDLFAPLGITRMRLGKTRLAERFPGEVRYHMPTGTALVPSVFPGGGQVEFPYGAFALEAIEGAGGWTATVVDLARILSRIDGPPSSSILSANAFAELTKRPPAPMSQTATSWYGLGFSARPAGTNFNIWHTGSLPGTRTWMARFSNDVTIAVAFNLRPSNDDEFIAEVDSRLANFGSRNTLWPTQDLFALYFDGDKARLSQNGIVNAASFRGGAISPGLIVTIFGTKLGPSALATARVQNARLATTLDGTRVLFDGTPAPLVYVAEGQLSAIVPYDVAAKQRVKVEVERLGVKSDPIEIPVSAAAPAFFTANSSGQGPAAAVLYPEDRIAVLYATGEGLTDPIPADGQLAGSVFPKPKLPIKVFVGDAEAEILYAGASPGLTAGLFQLNIKYPPGTGTGSPLILQVGDTKSVAGVTLP